VSVFAAAPWLAGSKALLLRARPYLPMAQEAAFCGPTHGAARV